METAIEPVGGLLNWMIFNNIKVYKDVTVGDGLNLLNAAKSKDVAQIRAAVLVIASHAGYAMDATEIDEVVAAVMAHDVGASVYQVGDYLMKFAVQHLGYVPPVPHDPAGPIRLMGTGDEILDVRTMNAVQSKEWLGRNKDKVREGAKLKLVKRILTRHAGDEGYRLLAGEMSGTEVSALSPETVKKIIDGLRVVAKILTYGSILAGPYAPLVLIVANAINLIIARYDSLHPTTGAASSDHGLGLEDLAS